MSNKWMDKTKEFKTIDVRKLSGNFFPGLKKQAEDLNVGEGLHIIQTFEPHPLYSIMEGLGFEYHTIEKEKNEFHVYFYRTNKLESDDKTPFKPLALLNYPLIDEDLGKVSMEFWNVTWKSEKRTIPFEMRLLLSLTNAVGAGRMRQATRELIKAYAHGVTSAMLDDVFELIAWNQGIGFFSSEIGPTPLFKAYKMIKQMEKKDSSHGEILAKLMQTFGEKNQETSVL